MRCGTFSSNILSTNKKKKTSEKYKTKKKRTTKCHLLDLHLIRKVKQINKDLLKKAIKEPIFHRLRFSYNLEK